MTRIQLPLTGRMKMFGPGLIVSFTLLGLGCQVAWPWRSSAAAAILLSGLWMWQRFLARRPVTLVLESAGAISCICADGRVLDVSRILPGIIHPTLVCARLETPGGDRLDIFVPSDAVSRTAHWRLRRALVSFRPDQSDTWRGT